MKRTLLIGYGSSLRCDDGAGPEVARRVMALGLPGVDVLEAHQLLPEHAELLSSFERVVFVDASEEPDLYEVSMRRIEAAEGGPADSHGSDPQAILGLSRHLFGGAAEAWLVRLPGSDFSLGEWFSEPMKLAIPQAVAGIRALLTENAGRKND